MCGASKRVSSWKGIVVATRLVPRESTRRWKYAMSINGKQSNFTDDDLLEIASRYAIGSAESILSEIKSMFK